MHVQPDRSSSNMVFKYLVFMFNFSREKNVQKYTFLSFITFVFFSFITFVKIKL